MPVPQSPYPVARQALGLRLAPTPKPSHQWPRDEEVAMVRLQFVSQLK